MPGHISRGKIYNKKGVKKAVPGCLKWEEAHHISEELSYSSRITLSTIGEHPVRNHDGGVWGRTQIHRVVGVKKGFIRNRHKSESKESRVKTQIKKQTRAWQRQSHENTSRGLNQVIQYTYNTKKN